MIALGALALVTLEWLALGWLSGVHFPEPGATVATWSLRVLVGAVLVALAQVVLSFTPLGYAIVPLTLLLASAIAVALRLVAPNARIASDAKLLAISRRERLGWGLLGLILLAAGVRSFAIPEAGWDAFSHWGLRAQAFTLAGTIVDARSEHEYYPPLVPLLQSWLYLHRGSVSIDEGKAVWAVIGSAFAMCFGWHLRLAFNQRWTWLAPYFAVGTILSSTALLEGFWTGQADLALTAFLSLATLAAWQSRQSDARAWLVQMAVFAAAAALTKFEGLPRVGVVIAALIVVGLRSRDAGAWRQGVTLAVAAIGASTLWTLLELMRGIAPNGEHISALQLSAIPITLYALARVFGGLRTGGALLVAAMAWLVSGRSILGEPLRFLSLVVVGQALATFIAFLVSSTAADVEVATSATRLVEQFLPLALFAGAVGLSRIVHL